MLILIHPIRMVRMVVQAALEFLREEYERGVGEFRSKRTHSEGLFPFIRILSNVVVRELQTMAILLDVYLGVPVIYSTFMQYDELAHHFGPSSFQALRDLRRTDARIREIRRMIAQSGGRQYDLVILSDHGMTPSVELSRALRREPRPDGRAHSRGRRGAHGRAAAPFERELHGDVGVRRRRRADRRSGGADHPGVAAAVAPRAARVSRLGAAEVRTARVDSSREVSRRGGPRGRRHLQLVPRAALLRGRRRAADRASRSRATSAGRRSTTSCSRHPGVGLLGTRDGPSVHLESKTGRATIVDGVLEVIEGSNPLEPYGTSANVVRAVEHLVRQPNAGDIIIFGAYDGYEIVSFDDQIGAHGAAGGQQVFPFVIGPAHLDLDAARLDDARDIHSAIMTKYAV